jgi:ferredoxin
LTSLLYHRYDIISKIETGGKHIEGEGTPLRIQTENCGDCVFCVSVCPFEALTSDPETKKVKLDIDKCMLCGICYTACPSRLITIDYYNVEVLTEWLQDRMERTGLNRLALVCKGSKPPKEQIDEAMGGEDYILLTLPCVGRVAMQFYVGLMDLDVEKVLVMSCEEDECRYEQGSKSAADKANAACCMLEDFGCFEMLECKPSRTTVVIDQDKCSGCGTCVAICPYEALELKDGKSTLKENTCKGCGACVAVCRNNSIQQVIFTNYDMIDMIRSAAGGE